MAVEALEFGEEVGIGKMAVHDTDGIIGIDRSLQHAAHGAHGFHMTGRDIAGSTDKRKIGHGGKSPSSPHIRSLCSCYRTPGDGGLASRSGSFWSSGRRPPLQASRKRVVWGKGGSGCV